MHTLARLLIFLCVASVSAQTTSQEAAVYTWFDSATNSATAILLNGPLYTARYRSHHPDNTPFLDRDAFSTGNLTYDGQPFFNQQLKYDITRDQLIVQSTDNRTPVALISEKVSNFTLNGKRFVNLSQTSPQLSGFYEENERNDAFAFYIKHHKDSREIISNETLYSDFTTADSYVVFYKNAFYPISSKKSIIAVFPDHKSEISKFYASRGKQNTQMLESLFQYLKTIVK